MVVVDRCSVEGCERPVKIKSRGWCGTHYERYRIHGDVNHGPATTCSVPGCGRPHQARGFCTLHYDRWRTHGDPLHMRGAHGDPVARFDSYVDRRPNGCWLWTGHDNGMYGSFWDGERQVGAHRFAYEREHGPIPDGLVIDHLCRTPLCVNPTHLDAVTQELNVHRGARTQF